MLQKNDIYPKYFTFPKRTNNMKNFEAFCEQSTILTNAKIILEDQVVQGSLVIKEGNISEISDGGTSAKNIIDCNGDYLGPGLVELHTDNLERHLQPRPGAVWPRKAAILSHDSELASVGITTVFNALRVGSIISKKDSNYKKYARNVADDILLMNAGNLLRVSHFLHLRAEVCSETLLEEMSEFSLADRIGIVSIMDHTPGQRQFRKITKMKEYLVGKYNMTPAQMDAYIGHLYDLREQYGALHENGAERIGKKLGATLASHDDTTIDDVIRSSGKGVKIAEFPTTMEAAKACKENNISVMMGAPNLLRGASHSGNVAASDLVEDDLLKILSSDYAPSSLLMAAVKLGLITGNMAKGLKTATLSPARATNLEDRGEIAVGKRADLIRFRLTDELPRINGVWRLGQRIG